MQTNGIPSKEKVKNGDEDDEFDFSAYKPPPKSSFKPPSKNASKIHNSVELLKRFDQSVATSLFTTGAGSTIALPGVPLPNNIQFPSVFASPKNPLKEVGNDKKAFAAVEGRKLPLSEIDMNQIVPKSPRETSLDVSFDPSQALFTNSPYGASPMYKSEDTDKPKKSSENLRKDIFQGLDDSFEFKGFQTGLGVPAKIDEAALQAVRAADPESKNTGFQNCLGVNAKIDESAISASKQLLNTSNELAASAKTADVDDEFSQDLTSQYFLKLPTQTAPQLKNTGFQNCHGVATKIDENALKAVRAANPQKSPERKNTGFQNCFGVAAKIDEKALKVVRANNSPGSPERKNTGFQNCFVEKAKIDENALKAVRAADPSLLRERKNTGFQNCLGVKTKIDESALQAVRCADALTSLERQNTGFQNCFGVKAKIDESALQAVRDTNPPKSFDIRNTGFKTAHGVPMQVNEDALRAVKNSISLNQNTPKAEFRGFQTCLGTQVKPDEAALNYVRGKEEKSVSVADNTQNTTAENMNAKMDMLISEIPKEPSKSVTCPSQAFFADVWEKDLKKEREMNPFAKPPPNSDQPKPTIQKENVAKPDLPKSTIQYEELPKPDFAIKPSIKRKSDENEFPAKKFKPSHSSSATESFIPPSKEPKPPEHKEAKRKRLDEFMAKFVSETCLNSIHLPTSLRHPPLESLWEEYRDLPDEPTAETNIECEADTDIECEADTELINIQESDCQPSQPPRKYVYVQRLPEPKREEVNERSYQFCVNFFHPETDSIMYKYALLADELRLKEFQAKLTSVKRSSSFAIPVKSAAKNNSKHSTPIPSRSNKPVKSPDLALSPIKEAKSSETTGMIKYIAEEDEDFDMDLDEETEDRVMSDEEVKQLNALIRKIDEEIDCRKKSQENRYGVLFQNKKYYNERGQTIPLSQFKPQVNTEDEPADPDRNFNLFDFWPKEDILAGKKTSDDGTFSCAADGTFGSRHIQRTLHSSTINSSFHSKLSINWVENHTKLIKQKLAGYNNYLDHELREKVFTPDALVDQLRLRADLEFIDGKRSLIVKISEQDVAPAMPAVLFISSKEPLRLSDGWYEIKCDGDALIKQRLEKLPIGSKILICGATLAKDAQASHPLENISEIHITANSTKRVKWHTKLGPFYKNVPPSTLSSISSSGRSIYKLKLKITRKYPDIWLQDNPAKESKDRRVVFSKRQRDRWHAQKDKDLDKQRESLAASIRKKHRENLDEDLANLTIKEISVLDDPEEIYTAVTLSKDPEYTISNLTEEQRQKYQKFAEKQNFKINETFQREQRQSSGKTTKKLRFKVKEGNRTNILQIDESKLRDQSLKAGSIVIVEMANIAYRGQITIPKNGIVRVIEQEFVKPELPAEYANILPELAATTKEVDIVGIVVHLAPTSCVLADNKKQFVTVQLEKNTWDFEALDKIVLVGAVLAFKNLEVDRQKAAQLNYTHVSEVLSQVSDFQGSRGAVFNLFNAYNKVLARSGHEKFISAYRSSPKSSSFSTPTRPIPNSSINPTTPLSSRKPPGNGDRMHQLEMAEEKWSRSSFSFNQTSN